MKMYIVHIGSVIIDFVEVDPGGVFVTPHSKTLVADVDAIIAFVQNATFDPDQMQAKLDVMSVHILDPIFKAEIEARFDELTGIIDARR